MHRRKLVVSSLIAAAAGCTGPVAPGGGEEIATRRGAVVADVTPSRQLSWGGQQDDLGVAVAANEAGEAVMAGATRSFGSGNYDISIVSRDASGIAWVRTWGDIGNDLATAVAVGPNHDIYVTGWSSNATFTHEDMVLLKLNAAGTLVGARVYTSGTSFIGKDLTVDAAGNVIVVGTADKRAIVMKVSTDGGVVWSKS
jgi:hypothetical protein